MEDKAQGRQVRKQAFTLLEVFLYLGLLGIFICGILPYTISTHTYFQKQTKLYEDFVRTTLALDLLKQDLMGASCLTEDIMSDNVSFVKKYLSKDLAFHTELVEWKAVNNVAWRSSGDYDFNSKKWLSKHSTLFACSIQKLRLKVHAAQNRIVRVDIIYEILPNKEECISVTLRNRVLV